VQHAQCTVSRFRVRAIERQRTFSNPVRRNDDVLSFPEPWKRPEVSAVRDALSRRGAKNAADLSSSYVHSGSFYCSDRKWSIRCLSASRVARVYGVTNEKCAPDRRAVLGKIRSPITNVVSRTPRTAGR